MGFNQRGKLPIRRQSLPMLLDEPFALIDREGRVELWRLLRETLDHHGTPAVFVTHDADEALALGDQLVRYERGRSQETGSPSDLLAGAHPVIVEGEPVTAPTSIGNGRAVVTLRSVAVEAPEELLRDVGKGPLRLALRSRPRRNGESSET